MKSNQVVGPTGNIPESKQIEIGDLHDYDGGQQINCEENIRYSVVESCNNSDSLKRNEANYLKYDFSFVFLLEILKSRRYIL